MIFAGILYYDGQSFLVSAKNKAHDLSRLNGASICVVKGTTHEANLADYFRSRNWSYRPVIVESQAKAAEALFSGQCEAFTSEQAQLTAIRLKAPGGPEEYTILPEQISKEPMGLVVRRGDDEWFTIREMGPFFPDQGGGNRHHPIQCAVQTGVRHGPFCAAVALNWTGSFPRHWLSRQAGPRVSWKVSATTGKCSSAILARKALSSSNAA